MQAAEKCSNARCAAGSWNILLNKLLFCYKREKERYPALFVMGIETYSDIREFGSQRKLSVERPVHSGIMPDLTFKMPTCFYRDSSFVLHGKVGHLMSQLRDQYNFCFNR